MSRPQLWHWEIKMKLAGFAGGQLDAARTDIAETSTLTLQMIPRRAAGPLRRCIPPVDLRGPQAV